MISHSEIEFGKRWSGSNVLYHRARQVLEMLLEQHVVLKLLVERLPEKMWVRVLALHRALGRADILQWLVSTKPAVAGARDAYNIRTTFVGNNNNAENRCVVLCGPDCADAVDEAHIIDNTELLEAAVTIDDSKRKRMRRWLERTPTVAAALPAAGAKRVRASHTGGSAAAPPSGVAGGSAAAAASGTPPPSPSRGAPFSSGRRRRVAVEGRSRDDLQRELDTTRRQLLNAYGETPAAAASIAATRITAAEARAVEAEAHAADAEARAAVATARTVLNERLARVYERAILRMSRENVARDARHERALKIVALGARVQLERGKNELRLACEELALERAKSATLDSFKAHVGTLIGAQPRTPTGAHSWRVDKFGRLVPGGQHKLRLIRLTRYLEDQFGGADAAAYEIARRAGKNKEAISRLGEFASYNSTMQRRFDRACAKAAKDPKGAERAFIAKLHVGMGARKMAHLNNEVYDGHEVDVGAILKLRKLKIHLTRSRLAGAKNRLVARYGQGGSAPIAAHAPKIEAVTRPTARRKSARPPT